MNHEPECHSLIINGKPASAVARDWRGVPTKDPTPGDLADCIFCAAFKSSYQRGREDAAQAIINQVGGTQDDGNVSMVAIPQQGWHQIDVAEACIAAARGDGETDVR